MKIGSDRVGKALGWPGRKVRVRKHRYRDRYWCWYVYVLRVTQGYARTVYTRKQTDRRTALPITLEQARRLRVYLAVWEMHGRCEGPSQRPPEASSLRWLPRGGGGDGGAVVSEIDVEGMDVDIAEVDCGGRTGA